MKKRSWLPALASAAGMLVLILDSRTALAAAAEGVALCLKTVIPSLFPFIFLSGIFSGCCDRTGFLLRAVGKPLGIPPGLESILVPALLGGYPVGAQCLYQAHNRQAVGKRTAERMLAYCSNVGPAFLFGILPKYFDGSQTVWLIWGIQLLSIMSAAFLFSPSDVLVQLESRNGKSFGIEQAGTAMLKICGWVILFRVVMSFLNRWFLWMASSEIQVAVTGLLELVGGCCALDKIGDERLRFCVCNTLLAFGGICVAYQTASVCPGLRMRWYLLGKLTQAATAGIAAAAICYGLWYGLPIWLLALLIIKNMEKRVEISSPRVYNGSKERWRA